jgi:hypothetical protein
VIPLPHPSGANLWLNRPEHQELVCQALAHVAHHSALLGLSGYGNSEANRSYQ